MKVCGAKTRSGSPCKNRAMPNGRCRMHGGSSPPAGPEHHAWKHGRRSQLARFAGGPVREDQLNQRLEIAAMDALIDRRIEALDSDSEPMPKDLIQALRIRADLANTERLTDMKAATSWTAGEIILLINEIVRLLNLHVEDYETRKAIARPLRMLSNRNRPYNYTTEPAEPEPVVFHLDSNAKLT